MNQVFRLAQPGFDVLRGKIGRMILDNNYAVPKIDTQANPPHAGIIFLNWADKPSGLADGTIQILDSFPHYYNKMPTVMGNYKFDNGGTILGGMLPFQLGALGIIVLDADDVNINLKYYSIDTAFPSIDIPAFLMQIRFYVMADHGYEN